jgi:hypothetical protein
MRRLTSASNLDDLVLDALADALLQRMMPKIRAAILAEMNAATTLMTARDTPSPRATMAACRRGEIGGARKVHRRWTFTKAAWEHYVESVGTGSTVNDGESAEAEDAELAALRAELGLEKRNVSASGESARPVHRHR